MSVRSIIPKRRGFELEMKTFEGESGCTYLVFRTKAGAFHAFRVIDAKGAAEDCGSKAKAKTDTTRYLWKKLWGGK